MQQSHSVVLKHITLNAFLSSVTRTGATLDYGTIVHAGRLCRSGAVRCVDTIQPATQNNATRSRYFPL